MSELRETEYGLIADDWKFIPSTKFCLKITDGTHDSPKEQKTGKHLITSKHIKGRNIDFESAYLISEDDFNKINLRSKVEQWDVIISMIGEYCGFSFIERNKDIDYAVKNVGLFKTGSKNKAFWLYYFLNSKIGRFILDTNKSGTSQPYLTLGFLRELLILYPNNEKESDQVVEVLSSLDDKIDLLHRQNKTLEQLAETLFRQWFVEEAEEQSEKQLLLGDLIDSVSLTHKFPSDKVVFLNTSDIYLGDVLVHEPIDVFTLPGQAKKTIQKNDILFSEIRPANGRYAYINFDAENYVVSTKLMVLRSKNILSQAFIYFYLTNSQTVDWLQVLAESRSGTFPQITFDQLKDLKINIPSDAILNNAVRWCETSLEKIKSNTTQIHTLTQLRDTLLPKLMSGEIRVNN